MLSLIVLVLFPFVIWSGYKKLRLARSSTIWPTVPGVVTASERTKLGWRMQPRVAFSYTVNNANYFSTKISFADFVAAADTEPTLQRYPLSQPVTVHYKPGDPAVAVLEPGANRYVTGAFRSYIFLFVAIVFVNVANIGLVIWQGAHPDAQARTYDDAPKADTNAHPGDATQSDIAEGDRLLREDAEKGDAKAQTDVGFWYYSGTEGYTKDYVEAAKWYRKAADQGNAEGENMLGQLYISGKGVDKDIAQGLVWINKAAAQGEPHACFSLGFAYEKGLAGMPQDNQKAIEWYRKAGDDPHVKDALARLHAN